MSQYETLHMIVTGEWITNTVRDKLMAHNLRTAHEIFDCVIPAPTREQREAVLLGDAEFQGATICDKPDCCQCEGLTELAYVPVENKQYKSRLSKHKKYIKQNFVEIDGDLIVSKSKVSTIIAAEEKYAVLNSRRRRDEALMQDSSLKRKIVEADDERQWAKESLYQEFGLSASEEYEIGSYSWKLKLQIDSLIELVKAHAVSNKDVDELLSRAKDEGWYRANQEVRHHHESEMLRAFLEKQPKMKSVPKNDELILIGGHKIPKTLLTEYVNSVRHVRTATLMGVSREDPLATMNALSLREKIHREIFKAAKLKYHSDIDVQKEKLTSKEHDSLEFNEALNDYLTKETGDLI